MGKAVVRAVALAAGCASLGACATVTRGAHTNWAVTSSPPGAAVKTSNGLTCSATPCTLRVSRKAEFTATVSKPGYKPVDVRVSHELSTGGGVALFGNVLIGGLIGVALDLTTGAINNVTPNNVDLPLEHDQSYAYTAPAHSQPAYGASFQPALGFDARGEAAAAAPASEGRIVILKVLSDGSVQETHERLRR